MESGHGGRISGCAVVNTFASVVDIRFGLFFVSSWIGGCLILLQDLPGIRTWPFCGTMPIEFSNSLGHGGSSTQVTPGMFCIVWPSLVLMSIEFSE